VSCPAWLDAVIAEGLAALAVLRLPGCPAADTINLTADIWGRALMAVPHLVWDEHRDRARLQAAFARLCIECDEWPGPKQLLRWLPEREPLPALPGPPAKLHSAHQVAYDQLMRDVASTNAELAAQGLPPLTRLEILALGRRGVTALPGTLGALAVSIVERKA